MFVAYIALGSNISGVGFDGIERDSKQWLDFAVEQILDHHQLEAVSISDYVVSKPLGPEDQPTFMNACLRLETQLNAFKLFDIMQTMN